MSEQPCIVVTCEHGGNTVPKPYRRLFNDARWTLGTHLAFDPGALPLALSLAAVFGAPLHFSQTTRLLVDLNRSLSNPEVFSKFTRGLSTNEQRALVATHYRPYRSAVRNDIARQIRRGRPVLHISVHSFTPLLRGVRRAVDLGLLFDPASRLEERIARPWRSLAVRAMPHIRVRLNQPYLGTSDGFTTALRQEFGADRYAGIEVEINQRFRRQSRARFERICGGIIQSLAATLA